VFKRNYVVVLQKPLLTTPTEKGVYSWPLQATTTQWALLSSSLRRSNSCFIHWSKRY